MPQELDFVHYYSQLFTNNSLSALAKTLTTITSVLYALHDACNGSHWWLNYETHPRNWCSDKIGGIVLKVLTTLFDKEALELKRFQRFQEQREKDRKASMTWFPNWEESAELVMLPRGRKLFVGGR